MHSTAPLPNLTLSELNVRRTDRELDIDSLADDLEAKGLLQNLVVVPQAGRSKGGGTRYGVVAGGRRLLALQLLDRDDRWSEKLPPKGEIPILIEARADGRESSLAENVQKVAMNPADEYEAFAQVIADYEERGESDPVARVERCARHFGKTVRQIEQRLRLAGLAPDILDALRRGEISIDAAKAYAIVPDHALQMQAFALQSRLERHSVSAIRAVMAGRIYRGGDRQVRYVGLEAYVTAGGRVDRDLFMGAEEEDLVLDTALLDRLCREKAEPEADRLAKALGYARGAVWPWGPNSHEKWPDAPKDHGRAWFGSTLRLDEKEQRILIFEILGDGSGLRPTDKGFVPNQAGTKAGPAGGPSAPAGAGAGAAAFGNGRRAGSESETEQLARIRRRKIEQAAVRLALPSVAGTAFEGRTNWPAAGEPWVDTVRQDESGDYVVAILVRIPKDDVDLFMAAAERQLDAAEAKRDSPTAAADPTPTEQALTRPATAETRELVGESVE